MRGAQQIFKSVLIILLGTGLCQGRIAERIISHREAVLQKTTSHVYKSGVWSDGFTEIPYTLRIHIVRPTNMDENKTYPAMIMVHGGGFRIGNFHQFLLQAEFFSKRGIVCFLPEYRLRETNELGQKGIHSITIQEQLADIKRAIRWVRIRSEEFNVDKDKIIGWGGSSGGYLVSAATMIDLPDAYVEFQADEEPPFESSQLSAQILINPALDLTFYNVPSWRLSRDPEATQIGMSSLFNVGKSTPPTLLFNGREDTTTPPYMVQEFKAAMDTLGKAEESELILYENIGHGFANRDPFLDATMKRSATFLRKFSLADKDLDPLYDAESYYYKLNNIEEFNLSMELQILKPENWDQAENKRYPVGIFLHGGPMVFDEKVQNDHYEMAQLARTFADKKGFVSVVPDYQHPYISRTRYKSGAIKDIRAIFRWVRKNSDILKIDSSLVLAIGTGYGAHLALSTFVEDASYNYADDNLSFSPIPNAIGLINPVLSLNAVKNNEEMNVFGDNFLFWVEGEDTINKTDFTDFKRIGIPVYLIEGLADETYPHLEDALEADKQYPQGDFSFFAKKEFLFDVANFSDDFLHQNFVFPSPDGGGSPISVIVTAGEGGIASGGGNFSFGASATLVATPDENYRFTGWTGDFSARTNPLVLEVTVPVTISATFARQPRSFDRGSDIKDTGFAKIPGLGVIWMDFYPWVFKPGMGWFYVMEADEESVWLYFPPFGWLWTKPRTEFANYFFRVEDRAWIYFIDGEFSKRRFFNFDTGMIESGI